MANIPTNRVKRNGKVDLWDLGPQVAPKAPPAPESPDVKLKGADLAAAELEYEDACFLYKDELRAYSAAKKDYYEWLREKGGPIKVEFWGADARHALDNWPDRWKLDLPKNAKPGKAQTEADEMAVLEAEELQKARSRDPLHAGAAA